MATITKRIGRNGRVSYLCRVRLGGQPPQTRTFTVRREAEQWAATLKARVARGGDLPTAEERTRTVADAIERYCSEMLPELRSAADVLRQLGWWRQQIGDYTLLQVNRDLIADARKKLLAGGRKPATVNRYHAAITRLFNVVVKEWGWLDKNPLDGARKMREPAGRVRYLSDVERERLLLATSASDSASLHLAVLLALSTGARQGELLALTWGDLDLERGMAYLGTTKNGERRSLPLVGEALELLRQRAASARPGNRVLLDFRSAWNRACVQAGLRDFHFHDLRHTFASYLAMDGASLLEIANALGHKTLAMVKRYAHFCDMHKRGVVAGMTERRMGWTSTNPVPQGASKLVPPPIGAYNASPLES